MLPGGEFALATEKGGWLDSTSGTHTRADPLGSMTALHFIILILAKGYHIVTPDADADV